MPGFKAKYEHNLGKEVAIDRLKSFSEEVRQKYGSQVSNMEEEWSDGNLKFGFSIMGMKISGNMVVDDVLARIDGTLPFAAIVFRGKIEKEITEALKSALT